MAQDEAEPMLAGIELGGTKASAILGRGREILERVDVPTTTPAATLGALAARLSRWREAHAPRALGIASFGPIAIAPDAADYGRMLTTPKPGWEGAEVLAPLAAAIDGPVALHTDVTGAALAEGRWGAAQGMADFLYVTIGTGIGMGIVANGRPIIGRMHPEAGHLRVRRLAGDTFAGVCPYHGDCLEGLASGPAIAARAGQPGDQLAADDPAWGFVADALAEGFAALMMTLAPAAILIGGGVGVGQRHLIPDIRRRVLDTLAGYLPFVDDIAIEGMIRLAALGGDAGPLGTLALAASALDRE